jgi:hypothetical protein
MNRWPRRLLLAAAAGLLSACVHVPRPPHQLLAWAELPLRLSPASLGRELALQERMTVTAWGRTQQLDVALEVDAQAVRLAVLAYGQAVARLEWDGRELKEQRAPGWPAAITGPAVLRDLQLVHWPVPAIQPALPWGWTLSVEGSDRVLRLRQRTVIRVRYPADGQAELHNLFAGYVLRLEAAQVEAAR